MEYFLLCFIFLAQAIPIHIRKSIQIWIIWICVIFKPIDENIVQCNFICDTDGSSFSYCEEEHEMWNGIT